MSPSIHAEDGKVSFNGEHNSVTLRGFDYLLDRRDLE